MTGEPATEIEVSVTVNGTEFDRGVPARQLLVHFLRNDLGITSPRIGCETSVCGCCTVLLDGDRVKACTLLTAHADEREVRTLEGLASDGELTELQRAFTRHHALQCGYCTSGMVMAATGLLEEADDPSREDVKTGLAGNLCRCTGYRFIVDAVRDAAGNAGADAE